MFRQGKEFFHLHLRVMFVLVFAALLCQSEDLQKASVTDIKSCSHAASTTYALMKKDNFEEVVKDRNFLFNLLDCTKETHELIMKTSETEDCKTFDEMIPSGVLVSVMNQKIPEAIKTRSLAAEDQRLILLSVYLVHISHRIRYVFCSANFWTKDILTQHHRTSESVEKFHLELKKNIVGFLDATLMAQWKSGNITILENNTNTLVNILNNLSTTLIDLLEKIKSYIDKTYLESTWWPFSYFKRERKIIEKLNELRKETDTLQTELENLTETSVIDRGFSDRLLDLIWESTPTWLKRYLLGIGLISSFTLFVICLR
ncbi:uncharacterized protein LOC114971204 [Acropora millepora]|uniref:uncharacterized protein LOC114971204 n=1 Tax=Acropora millepora TaxID=45264 RepID=UPI001CF47C01|nr:uncharacterized protein LOC114971204 [Acropora millepora]